MERLAQGARLLEFELNASHEGPRDGGRGELPWSQLLSMGQGAEAVVRTRRG